jgi:hypothetical protein
MQSKHLKWALIILIIYAVYKTFISKKEDFVLIPPIGPNGTVTDVKNLVPGAFYQRATLKSGISNTVTGSLNGGTTCTEFPSTIYIPVGAVDAVCNLGANNINAYTPITETLSTCPIVNGVPTKTLNKITDVAAFNRVTTTTPAQYGGRDCFTQRQAFLNYIELFPCTSTIPSACDLTTVNKVYNPNGVADSFTTCNVNVGGVWNKAVPKWSDAEINARSTITQGINGGASCSAQATSLSATRNVPCGPVNATCQGNDPSGVQSNVNTNYNTSNIPGTPNPIIESSTFWSTCQPSGFFTNTLVADYSRCCSKTGTYLGAQTDELGKVIPGSAGTVCA